MRHRRRRIQRARNRGTNIQGEPIAPRTSGGAQRWERFKEIAVVGSHLLNKLAGITARLKPSDVERAAKAAKALSES